MTVRAVILDMGMTVLRAEPSYMEVFAAGCERAGLDLADRVSDHTEEGWDGFGDVWRAHNDAWTAAGHPSPHVGDADAERDFWTGLYVRLLELMDVADGDRAAVAAEVFDHFQRPTSFGPYPDALAALQRLEELEVPLAVCSNWGPALRPLLEHHDLLRRFDAVAISGEVGAAKPDVEVFRVALDGLGVEPDERIVHVGDDLDHDVTPALELGLSAVLIDRYDRHPDHDGPRIRALDELPQVLDLTDPRRTSSRLP